MSWSFAIFTFINAWCVMLFMAVPLAMRGHDDRARPPYQRIAVINTLAALALTGLLALLINSGWVTLRD